MRMIEILIFSNFCHYLQILPRYLFRRFIFLVINLQMTFSSIQKTIHMACLITVVLLVGMHIATAIKGYQYFVDNVEPQAVVKKEREITYKTYEARLILGMVAAGITFFTNLAAVFLVGKTNHIRSLLNLVVFNLVIQVGMGLITAMSIYEMSVTRDVSIKMVPPVIPNPQDYLNKVWDSNGFNLFWRLLIADGILTFVPQIAGLIYVYIGVSKEAMLGESKGDQITDTSNYSKF